MRGSFTATVTIGSPGSEKIYKKSLQISFGCGRSVSKNCDLLHITDLFNTTFVHDDFTFTSKIFLKHSLGIRLLHKRAPKLGRITGTSIIQPSLMCREEIVDDHLYPFSKPPKIESEHSTVASVIEALIRRTDCVKQFLRVCQRGHCSYKPAVEHSALRDVWSTDAFGEELWLGFANILQVQKPGLWEMRRSVKWDQNSWTRTRTRYKYGEIWANFSRTEKAGKTIGCFCCPYITRAQDFQIALWLIHI